MPLNPLDDRIPAPVLDHARMGRMKDIISRTRIDIRCFNANEEAQRYLVFTEIARDFGAVFLVEKNLVKAYNDDDAAGCKRIHFPASLWRSRDLEEITRSYCHEVGHIVQRSVFGGSGGKSEFKTVTEYARSETEAHELGRELFHIHLADKMANRTFDDLTYLQLQKIHLLQVLTVYDKMEDDRPADWRTPAETVSWPSSERIPFSECERRKKYEKIMKKGYCSKDENNMPREMTGRGCVRRLLRRWRSRNFFTSV